MWMQEERCRERDAIKKFEKAGGLSSEDIVVVAARVEQEAKEIEDEKKRDAVEKLFGTKKRTTKQLSRINLIKCHLKI